ncbi:MAG: hydrolase TatD, partial [Lachnospiraceae bacterium]|nr:hydrolase TatD [Lachnospiraceae bacterium]
VEAISRIKQVPAEEVVAITEQNGRRLYRI